MPELQTNQRDDNGTEHMNFNGHCAVSSVYDEDLDDQGHKFIIKPVTLLTICGLSFSLLFSLLLSSLFAAAISFQTTNGQILEC